MTVWLVYADDVLAGVATNEDEICSIARQIRGKGSPRITICSTETGKAEFEEFDLSNAITEGAAREFYRDLCGTVYGNADKTAQGIMSAALIADHMKMPIEKANAFLNACRRYGVTERQGGAWVV